MGRVRRSETRRDQILVWMAEYITENHNAPSAAKVAKHFGISEITAYRHMVKLVAESRLQLVDGGWKIPEAEYVPPPDIY